MGFKVRKYNRGIVNNGRKYMPEICRCDSLDCNKCYGLKDNRQQKDNTPQCNSCPKYLTDVNDIAEQYYSYLIAADVYLCNSCSAKQHKELETWLNLHSSK